MDEQEKNHQENGEWNINELLKERARIDELLKTRYRKDVTILFSDIKGSTTFFDTRGDIEGRAMIQQHNEMLFPLIEQHGGKLIKTMGDAIMASFKEPLQAVKSAIDMQKTLSFYNQGKAEGDQIRIRIGINTGRGLIETQDVFGEVVIVAARLENIAQPEQILISRQVYEKVKTSDEVICRYLDTLKLKGIIEAQEIYQVVWGEVEMVASPLRTAEKPVKERKKRRKVIQLEISREGEKLKVSIFEKKEQEEKTIKPYEENVISFSRVEERCKEIEGLLSQANIWGALPKDILRQLKDTGQLLYDELLPLQAKNYLKVTSIEDLVLNIDDGLVQIPWELLFDGEQFLCMRFNMGRLVKTRQSITGMNGRSLEKPLRMLILTDPKGDLKDATEEGRSIREEMDKNSFLIHAYHKSGHISVEFVKEKIRNFDIVHYAGHADYDQKDPSQSGWIFEDEKFTSAEISKMVGARPFPALVFSNACQSGQTEEWKIEEEYGRKIYGLANAFLLAGVQHYIGTFWEVLDRPSSIFSREFYQALITGSPIGEAVRKARMSLIKKYGEDSIIWASYMLYGDPTFIYLDVSKQQEGSEGEDGEKKVALLVRSLKEEGKGERLRKKLFYPWVVVLLFIMAGILSYISIRIWRGEQEKSLQYRALSEIYTNEGVVMERSGKLDEAMLYYRKALQVNPQDSYASVFLREAQRKLEIVRDREKQARIDALLIDLLQKSEKKVQKPKEMDNWTSRPLILTFLPLERKGETRSAHDGESEYIILKLTSLLQAQGGTKIVEREVLDRLLEELKLSRTALVDQQAALRVGKILSARLVVTGSTVQQGSQVMLSLKFIETETTKVLVAFTESINKSNIDIILKRIAQDISLKLKKEFPLRGKIISIKGEKIDINIGSDVGVRKGLFMRVLGSEIGEERGFIKIISVSPSQSQAKVVKKVRNFVPGARTEELIEG